MKKQNKNPNTSRKQFGDYILGKTLGKGTFGKVKLGTHKLTGQHVAIKVLQKSKILDVADVQRVSRQIHILKLIRHPNIVQLYQIVQTPKQLHLIMEFMEGGQLFNYIVKNKRIKQQQACTLFHQLIDGIQYIHKIGVTHRDLKPQNLLIDLKGNLKIVDFGLSNTYKQRQRLKTPCGSPCYAAPQMIKGQKYDGLKVDIWSSGVILFAMVCGYLPFEDQDTHKLYSKILQGKLSFHHSISSQVKQLISSILTNDQNKRFTIQKIRNHQWMSIGNYNSQPASGIIVGLNNIPIDQKIVHSLQQFNFDSDYVNKCLEANRHNNVTTAYYLALKKFRKQGGMSKYDISNKNFDRTLLQPHKKKDLVKVHKILMDNFLSRGSEQNDKENIEKSKQKKKLSKQRPISRQRIVSTNLQLKQTRTSSKSRPKQLQNSINYGYCRIPLASTSKSNEKSIVFSKRDSMIENRISRKYKQKFNQSLISKSKQKERNRSTNRSRINSSIINHKTIKPTLQYQDQNTDLSNFIQQHPIKDKKGTKKTCSLSIKVQHNSKIVKARRF